MARGFETGTHGETGQDTAVIRGRKCREPGQGTTGKRNRVYRDLGQEYPHPPPDPLGNPDHNFKLCSITSKEQQQDGCRSSAALEEGKDELNLAEFPLTALSDRVGPGQTSLLFEDRVWDQGRGEMVTRKLRVAASDKYGLPTAKDDEVVLGLVQLSKLHHFADRRVPFMRYQLIQILGWRHEGKSYARLEESLHRWVGVTLYYENAWWDREERSWVDEAFHILDNVTLYDRERIARRRAIVQDALPLSHFTWNDVLFRSFRAGNLKSLDFEFFKGLHSAIAKRLYRFLDKRFFHRRRWEFDLRELCWEHVGLSRGYADAANLKRKLLPAVVELEEQGFLKADSERFSKVSSGQWRVVFEKGRAAAAVATPTEEEAPLRRALLERGVSPTSAARLLAARSEETIQRHLEVFDWLVSHRDPKVSRNAPGFLVSSIQGDYAAPKGFSGQAEKKLSRARIEERKQRADEKHRIASEQREAQERSRSEAIAQFWASLPGEERQRLETDALEAATPLQRDLIERGGAFARATRQTLLDASALRQMPLPSAAAVNPSSTLHSPTRRRQR
jgi:hypothetical protein